MKEEAPPANDRTSTQGNTTAIKAGEDPWSGPGEKGDGR